MSKEPKPLDPILLAQIERRESLLCVEHLKRKRRPYVVATHPDPAEVAKVEAKGKPLDRLEKRLCSDCYRARLADLAKPAPVKGGRKR